MQSRFLITCLPAMVFAYNGYGQSKSKTVALQFHSINTIGLLEGESGEAFQLQSVNGLAYKTWFAGIGAGLDYYRYRSVPLFFDLRKEFPVRNNALFVYGDIGPDFNWATTSQKQSFNLGSDAQWKTGLYTDAGIGFAVHAKNNQAFLMSLGFSHRDVKADVQGFSIWSDQRPVPRNEYSFGLNRVSMKVGWKF